MAAEATFKRRRLAAAGSVLDVLCAAPEVRLAVRGAGLTARVGRGACFLAAGRRGLATALLGAEVGRTTGRGRELILFALALALDLWVLRTCARFALALRRTAGLADERDTTPFARAAGLPPRIRLEAPLGFPGIASSFGFILYCGLEILFFL